MRFRILGPLEVFDGTGWKRVPASKPRTLLAVLLISGGEPTATHRLVEALWGEHAPKTARNLIQQYVMRLRRTLRDRQGRILVTRPPGYQLALTAEDLDASAFALLEAAGRNALDAGEPERAATLLSDALRMWRGSPLADVPPIPAVQAEMARLEERRLAVLEACIEADLARGEHDAVVPELRKLVIGNPLRERLRAHLMLALYRSGRQAEALGAYREIYRLLRAELSVEPASALQRLHQRILRADPALNVPAPARGDVAATVPRQLPPAVSRFAGRRAELRLLDDLVESGRDAMVTLAIDGPAGVGKSALAVHWAHRVAHRFPGGQLYVNLRGFDPSGTPLPPRDAICGLLDALEVPPERIPKDLTARTGLYRTLLSGRQMLIVLDNARDAEQVRPLLPASPGCVVVVTSRSQLTGLVATDDAHLLTLDVLPPAEARELLMRRLPARRLTDSPAVAEVIERCARLPLALAIAAARAAARPAFPLGALAAELRDALLNALHTGDAASDVRAVFSWSLRQLNEPAERVFRLLGLHPGPDISRWGAARLAGIPIEATGEALYELTRAHLLTEHTPGRFACHNLLRAYATERALAHDGEADRHKAVRRVLDHYLNTAHAAARLLNPARTPIIAEPSTPEHLKDDEAAMAWFEAERAVLLAATAQAADAGLDRHAWQLPWTLVDYLDRRGYWNEWEATQRTALAAAVRLGDRSAQALAHHELSRALVRLGHHDAAAELGRAFESQRRTGDKAAQAARLLEPTAHSWAVRGKRIASVTFGQAGSG